MHLTSPAPGAGDALHAVDAATGRLLWSVDGFTTLPSAPRALDLDGDGYVDRAYLIDVTGNLWRIDFASGAAAADLASARRIARLGTGAHRFFATPDASVTQVGGESRLSIAVGSGALTRPRDASVVDRVYVVFDALAGEAAAEIEEEDLFDATDATGALPPDARGWFARLESHGAGEKVVGSTVTFDHRLHFQTYQPLPPDAACALRPAACPWHDAMRSTCGPRCPRTRWRSPKRTNPRKSPPPACRRRCASDSTFAGKIPATAAVRARSALPAVRPSIPATRAIR